MEVHNYVVIVQKKCSVMFHFELFVSCVFMKNMMGFFRPERLKVLNSVLKTAPKIMLHQFHKLEFPNCNNFDYTKHEILTELQR